MFHEHKFAAGKERGAFHRVAQLAHVARPRIIFQARGNRFRKPRAAFRQLLDELGGQRQNILLAFAQRRNI